MAKTDLRIDGVLHQYSVRAKTDALAEYENVRRVKENLCADEMFVPFHASPLPTGFQGLRRAQPLLLILVGGILLTLFGIMGCSDVPYLGSMLTANDVDRYIFSTEDTICLESEGDSACVIYVLVNSDGANEPVIHVHPTKVIYVFYHEGKSVLRAATTGQATDVSTDVGTDVGVDDVGIDDVGIEGVGIEGVGVGDFVGNSFISSNTNEDNTKNGGDGNDDSLRSENGVNNNGGSNNGNGNNGNNGDNGNNADNSNNNNGDGNNGGSGDGCESGYIVWTAEVNGNKQSGVICKKYTVIDEGNNTITFTGADGKVDGGDNESTEKYVAVETGYTYEEASDRAPKILREWAERKDE